ncbi:MAG: PqqD family protein [Lachnospiraceae bacterium]|nr:PqqD family protein [Lachnospiraceae bacterium]
MEKGKSSFTKPGWHNISHIGPLINDEIAELSNEDLEGYLTQNGYLEEKRMYQANPDFIVRKIAGETLAVPIGTAAHDFNGAMILSEVGASLWESLSQVPQTKADLVHALQENYDVAPETAFQDVSFFLEKALSEGVVKQTQVKQ